MGDAMEEDEDYDLQMALALSMQDYGPAEGAPQAAATPAAQPDLEPAPPPAFSLPAAGTGTGAGAGPGSSAGAAGANNPADLAAILAAALQSVTGQQNPAGAAPAASTAQQQQTQQIMQQQMQQMLQSQAQAFQQLSQQQQQQQAPPQPQPPPQQQRQPQRRSQAKVPAAPPSIPPLPHWAEELGNWWQLGFLLSSSARSSSSGGTVDVPWLQQKQLLAAGEVQVPVAEVPAMLAAVSSMLAAPVVCPAAESAGGAAAAAAQRPAGALWLTCVASRGSGQATIRCSDLDSLIAMWIPRASASARGTGQLTVLALAAGRTPPPAQLPESEAAKQVVTLLCLRLAAKAVELMEQDEDDLFFENGQTRTEFLDALRSGSSALAQPGFISLMLTAVDNKDTADCWGKLLVDAFRAFEGYKLSGGVVELEPHMLALDRVTQEPRLLMMLTHTLVQEAYKFQFPPPPQLQISNTLQHSILAFPLSICSIGNVSIILRACQMRTFFSSGGGSSSSSSGGSVVTPAAAEMSPATALFTQLRSYPRNAGEIEGAKRVLHGVLGRIADAVHQVLKRLAGMKAPGVPAGTGREVLLSWLASTVASNEMRCKGGEYSALRHLGGAPDGPMLTLTAAVLRLTEPFVQGYLQQKPKFQDLLTRHLNPSYYTTHAARLGSAAREPSLSGQRGVAGSSGSSSSSGSSLIAADPAAAAGQASFISEVFFIAQRYIKVGLMPSVHRYLKMYGYLHDMLREAARDDDSSSSGQRQMPPEVSLYNDVTLAQLLQPDMTAHAVQFAVLEIVWLADLLKQQQQQPGGGSSSSSSSNSVFSHIPESVLSDASSWLTFVIQMREAEQLAAVDIGLLMRCLVTVLEHPDQVRSLLVVSKVIHLLLAMLAPQVHLQSRTRGALGRTHMSPGEMALVTSVLGTSAAQQQLVPALMRVYGQADFVVGLDVDKDDYDKFSMRHEIDLLLLELWQDTRCRGCIKQQASTPGGVFPDFVSAVLNDLMYLFKDSLERLADIKQIEDSKKDKKVWEALTDEQRRDKETFYSGQQRTASGFMRYANTTLELLITLTGDRDIGAAFMGQPLLGRTAYAALHFLELLVGPRCQQLDVENPKRYNFDQHALLLTMVRLTGQLAQHTAFPQALSEEPDYEDSLLQTAVDLLNKQHAYQAADSLSAVLASIAKTPARQSKKQRTGVMDGGSDAALSSQIEGLLLRWSQGLGGSPTSYDDAERAYSQALEPLAVGVFDADVPGAYNSHFKTMATQQEGDSSQKLRRLGRELRDLRGKTKLPVAAAAACFVTQDADRPDKVRCIITGPQDTPYEGGLFVFDVFFPEGYPNVPPLMVLETTGEGRARFNPNLYADGKVCLSLLGTWHGGDEASKWNPSSSSLFQILLSIQGMIFVEDPYFNEPAVELMRGTTEGSITSMRYNSEVRLSTLRWAVLALLKKPPPGLEEVVKAHFRVLRGVLVSRTGRWLREAATVDPSGTTFNRMVDVMDQIVEAAAAL